MQLQQATSSNYSSKQLHHQAITTVARNYMSTQHLQSSKQLLQQQSTTSVSAIN
jgi:hypothetical protein